MRQAWKYEVLDTNGRTALQSQLTSAGADGWELVSATAMLNTAMTRIVYNSFLERPAA